MKKPRDCEALNSFAATTATLVIKVGFLGQKINQKLYICTIWCYDQARTVNVHSSLQAPYQLNCKADLAMM